MVADSDGGTEVAIANGDIVEVTGNLIVSVYDAQPADVRVDVYGGAPKTFEPSDVGWVALGAGAIIAGIFDASGNSGGTTVAEFYQGTVELADGETVMVQVFVKETQIAVFFARNIVDNNEGEVEGEKPCEGENVAETYTLATSVQGQGTISPVSGIYDAGEVVQVAATPASGWHFYHWTVNGEMGISDPQAQITMDSDVQLVAVFVKNTATEGENVAEGEDPIDTRGKVVVNLTASGGTVTFTATAPDGYSYGTFGGVGTTADIGSIGLNLFYLIPRGGAWSARETFPFSGTWPVTGVMTKLSGSTLRFEVVANASGCWGDPEKLVVKLNGTLVPRVADEAGNVAYQVVLPS